MAENCGKHSMAFSTNDSSSTMREKQNEKIQQNNIAIKSLVTAR